MRSSSTQTPPTEGISRNDAMLEEKVFTDIIKILNDAECQEPDKTVDSERTYLLGHADLLNFPKVSIQTVILRLLKNARVKKDFTNGHYYH